MDRCPNCPAADLVWCAAESHRRYCDLTGDPAYRRNIILRSEAGPLILAGVVDLTAIPPVAPPPPLVLIGFPPCGHRTHRWNCGGEMGSYCALGHGAAPGIIEAHDCRACKDATP